MLPPKKNQAAREELALQEDKKPEADDAAEEQEEQEDEVEYKNVFEETLVQGKRKHFVPRGKQVVEEWLSEHFEEREGRKCPVTQVYSAYLQLCIEQKLTDITSEQSLGQTLKARFPKGFAVRAESGLNGKIKDYAKVPKSASTTGGNKYKMKEVIKEAFEDLKDPSEGLMFNRLRKHLMGKLPALQLDLKPKLLLRGLEMGVFHGYVELVKGTGRAGKYRWFNPDREEEEKPAKKKKKAEGEIETEEGDKDEEPASADSTQEEETEKKEEKENGDVDSEETKKKPAAKKKQRKRVKTTKKSQKIIHSNPINIEQTFPLAFTFMAEPKEARVNGIVKYIERHYNMESQAEKIMKVLDSGADKGYWHLVQGTNRTGIYQLAVDEFDPSDDDDLIGKIINAIMASVEPKTCSARALKEYLIEFHPDYNIADRPNRFKKALERALNKGILRQLTGIGASGTFQLQESFIPSPIILAGKDTASDYEEESSDEEEFVAKGPGGPQFDLTYFQDAYKPRPSARRGMTRQVAKTGGFNKNAAYFEAKVKQETVRMTPTPRKRKAPFKNTPQKKGQKKQKSQSSPKKSARYLSSDEDDEESDKEQESSEEDSTYGSDGEKYKPRPSSSRGGGSRSAPPKQKAGKGKASKAKTPVKKTPVKKEKVQKGKKSPSKAKAVTKAKKKSARKSSRR